jgi:hypothetical protein
MGKLARTLPAAEAKRSEGFCLWNQRFHNPQIDLELSRDFAHNTPHKNMPSSDLAMHAAQLDFCDIQRRSDGAVLVRVHSCDRQGRQLPDAVFTFRSGDPQYDYWAKQLRERLPDCQPR